MIWSIQYLRGAAALMVVYHHADFQLLKLTGEGRLLFSGLGAAGVDIFFVISGFIMWVTTHGAPVTPAQFLYRRFVRIAPLYWAITVFVALLTIAAPRLFNTTAFDPAHIAFSLLFIPVPHPALPHHVLPFFIQGWTLNYEMFFYLIFALTIWRAGSYRLAAIVTILAALAVLGLMIEPQNAQIRFFTSTLILEFVFGAFVGWLYVRRKTLPAYAPLALLGLGVTAFLGAGLADIGYGPNGFDPMRALYWGVPATAIVAGAAFMKPRAEGVCHLTLSALGNASYSLYLSHLIALPATVIVWGFLGLQATGVWAGALATFMLFSAVIGGWLTYIVIEKPMTVFLQQRAFAAGRRDQESQKQRAADPRKGHQPRLDKKLA